VLRRHADMLSKSTAEAAQRRLADCATDLGHAKVALAQELHRAFEASRHQLGVRWLAVGEPELTAEVRGRHVLAAGERRDVQRFTKSRSIRSRTRRSRARSRRCRASARLLVGCLAGPGPSAAESTAACDAAEEVSFTHIASLIAVQPCDF
jgi:hypothetical protein